MKNEKNEPIKSIRAGAISVSVFENTVKTKDKKSTTIPSIVFQKRYTDDKGKWHTTSSMNVNDLPKAILCLQKAYDFAL